MAICAQQAPPALEVASGHVSACWLHAKDAAAGTPQNAGPVPGSSPLTTLSQPDSRPPQGEST